MLLAQLNRWFVLWPKLSITHLITIFLWPTVDVAERDEGALELVMLMLEISSRFYGHKTWPEIVYVVTVFVGFSNGRSLRSLVLCPPKHQFGDQKLINYLHNSSRKVNSFNLISFNAFIDRVHGIASTCKTTYLSRKYSWSSYM